MHLSLLSARRCLGACTENATTNEKHWAWAAISENHKLNDCGVNDGNREVDWGDEYITRCRKVAWQETNSIMLEEVEAWLRFGSPLRLILFGTRPPPLSILAQDLQPPSLP